MSADLSYSCENAFLVSQIAKLARLVGRARLRQTRRRLLLYPSRFDVLEGTACLRILTEKMDHSSKISTHVRICRQKKYEQGPSSMLSN